MIEEKSALEELCEILLEYGLSESEINSLVARVFEEETMRFIEAMAALEEDHMQEDEEEKTDYMA